MDILTIQSAVLHGSVGNNAAVPVLQTLGWDPLALHTVWYSHHKGHPRWFGEVTAQPLFEQFLSYAFQARHLNVTTVLSGYLGSAAQATALARALPARVRYVCDPVMGDTPGGQYVGDDLVRAYREQLLPRATIVVPNPFELSLLTGAPVSTPTVAIEAAQQLLRRYPRIRMVVVTGVPQGGALHLCAVSRQHQVRTRHPWVDYDVSGTGDAFCAAWLGLYLRTNNLYTSLMYAGRFMYRVVRRTAEEQQRELQLIAELPWLQRTAMRVTSLPFSPQDHAE
jgi:pyridoxine kinase